MKRSIWKNELAEKVLELIEKALELTSYRIVDLDCFMGRGALIRLFIEDKEKATASIEDCEKVSRLVEGKLESSLNDLVRGSYQLEVSSPGLDRRLRLEEDFQKYMNKDLRIRLRNKIFGLGEEFTGNIQDIQGEKIKFQVRGKDFLVSFSEIKQANLVIEVK